MTIKTHHSHFNYLFSSIDDLSVIEWLQVHNYVLENSDAILPFISEHKQIIQEMGAGNIEKIHQRLFPGWLETRVSQLYKEGKVDDGLLSLSRGPDKKVISYTGIDINGFRFHTQDRDTRLTTQNSGVIVKVETNNRAFFYYGVLDKIFELFYMGRRRVHIFKCEWWDMHSEGRGFKRDKFGFVSLNVKRKLKTNEPFVLAYQAKQCFYVRDLSRNNWIVSTESPPRDVYNMTLGDEGDGVRNDQHAFQECESNSTPVSSLSSDAFDVHHWKRHDVAKSLSMKAAKKQGWIDKDGNHIWESIN